MSAPQANRGLDVAAPSARDAAAEDVRAGLSGAGQKSLPSRLLYDDVGSALFDVISLLPEYGLTRADERILRSHAAEIVGAVPPPRRVIELGSGSARKTRWILEAAAAHELVPYHPIDLSSAAIAASRNSLADLHAVRVEAVTAEYLPGLRVATRRRKRGETLLVLFLGSTIGNFDAGAARDFLSEVRSLLAPGDALLLGTDLVKSVPRLLAAYDDSIGVTAAFNKNVLARLNRELGAEFELERFRHEARWNEAERNVEMHLVSRVDQTVTVSGLDLRLALRAGESIWTESSHKFAADEPALLGERAGFATRGQWLDREWSFAETLLVARD